MLYLIGIQASGCRGCWLLAGVEAGVEGFHRDLIFVLAQEALLLRSERTVGFFYKVPGLVILPRCIGIIDPIRFCTLFM